MNKANKNIAAMVLAGTVMLSAGATVAHATNDNDIKYTIESGDTLTGISKKYYGSSSYYDELAAYNGIANPDFIRAGATIYIPKTVEGFNNTPTKPEESKPIEGACGKYVIQSGDTLSEICKWYYGNSSYAWKLATYNNIANADKIYSGQTIILPDVETLKNVVVVNQPQTNIPTNSDNAYVIQRGDTLSEICRNYYGSTSYTWKLATYNNLANPNIIRSGNILLLPSLETLKNVQELDYTEVIEEQMRLKLK